MARRRIAVGLVTALLAAGCTAGSDVSTGGAMPIAADPPGPAADGSETPVPTTTTIPVTTTVESSSTTTSTTLPPIEVTRLPGLANTSDGPFPNDDSVRTGVLDNGLTYYVRSNDQPGGRASLRLAIDAGSVDELGEETGVAHFAEHMLFNGTTAYPENELIDVLRGFGAEFGPDINAYTDYDETVYVLDVPNDGGSVDEAMRVLAEWLSNATIDEDQVEAEQGVVLDEWRVRTQTVSGRLYEIAERMYLAGTPFAGRRPIGDRADIESMSAPTLRTFYDAWYRPENAAIVVVGDIDVGTVVDRIAERFGSLAGRGEMPPRVADHVFDIDTEPDVELHTDRDQATVDVEVTLPLPRIEGAGLLAARAGLLDEVIFDALIRRLDRDVAAGTAPFDEIGPGSNSLVDQLDAPALYALTDAARVTEALEALLLEYERAFRYGFTDAEIEAAVRSARADWDAYLEQENEIQDAGYAEMLVENFLDGEPYPTVRAEYDLIVAELDAITSEAAAERFRARWTNSAPHVIISTPEAVADAMPSRDDVIDLIDGSRTADIVPREAGRELPDRLMERPAPVEVPEGRGLTRYTWEQLDPYLYTFPNGARVILNPNTIAQGSVFAEAVSPGGSSLVEADDIVDALYAAEVVGRSGIADFDQAEFAEIVSAGSADLVAGIGPHEESLSGQSSTADAETLFQLIHLSMTQPRFDPVALNQVVQSERPIVVDPSIEPQAASWDALNAARYGDELRYAVLPTPAQFDTLDIDGVERVWRDRFSNASDWVFVFTGDFDLGEFETLAAAYLGTLPGDGTTEQPVDVSPPPPPGIVTADVAAGAGETASVEMLFTSPIDRVDPRNDALAAVATAVLDGRLTRVIREEFGDSYSPFITSFVAADPEPVVQTYIRVTGAPGRIGTIADTVVAQIDDIANGGLTAAEYATAYAPVEEDYGFVDNGEYLRELVREATIPDYDFDAYVFEGEILAEVGQEDVVAFIDAHVTTDRYVRATATPR